MPDESDATHETRPGERIAKVIARAGLCSRREAESWIEAGRVSVNGETLASPAFNVSDDDDVRVDGKPLRERERTRLFAFHKPKGLVTTARDPEGRPTVFEALPADLPRVVTIGRLDINTEGLLLITNDGGLARVLELPSTGWLRRYRVRAHGEITQDRLNALADGVTVDGVNYAGIEARLERQQGSNVWLLMGLREGKNREIKRVLEHLGLTVNRLIRVSFGPFELGDLPEGAVEEIPTRVLRDQLGVKLAKQAQADFDAPIEAIKPEPPAPITRAAPGERPLRRGPRPANDDKPDPRREERERNTPQKRKHISILRAEARAEAAGERRRIERSATSDRKGREVKVEHISLARPAAAPVKPPRKRAAAFDDASAARPRSKGRGEDRPRSERPPGKRSERPDARPVRSRSESFGEAGARPRSERPSGERADARPARSRGEGFGEAGKRPRTERPAGARPPRRAEGAERPRSERSPGERSDARPTRPPSRGGKPGQPPRGPAGKGPGGKSGGRPDKRR